MPTHERKNGNTEMGGETMGKIRTDEKKRSDKAANEVLALGLLGGGEPRAKREGETVPLSAFELTTVNVFDGMDKEPFAAEEINEYLSEKAGHLGKTVDTLSEKEYHDLLADKKSFHTWVAARRIDNFIAEKKKTLRAIADGKTGDVRIGDLLDEDKFKFSWRGGYYDSSGSTSALVNRPEYQKLRSGADEKARLLTEIAREKTERVKEAEEVLKEMDAKFDAELDGKAAQLRAAGVSRDAIPAAIVTFQNEYKKNRAAVEKSQQSTMKEWEAGMTRAISTKTKELEELGKEIEHQVRVGTKREMVSVAARYDLMLRKILKHNEKAINLKDDGTFFIDLGGMTNEEKSQVFSSMDKEVARVVTDRLKNSGEKTRLHNLDALLEIDKNEDLLDWYRRVLLSKVSEQPLGAQRDHMIGRAIIISRLLLKEDKISWLEAMRTSPKLLHELGSDRSLEGVLFVKESVEAITKQMLDNPSRYDVRFASDGLVNLLNTLKEEHGLWFKSVGRRTHDSDLARSVESALSAVVDNMTYYDHNKELFDVYSLLCHEKIGLPRETKEALIAKIYRKCSKVEGLASEVQGHYYLPSTLKNHFLNSYGDLRLAASEQVALHFKEWSESKKGQENVKQTIESIRHQIEEDIRTRSANARSDFYRYTSLKNWQEREDGADEAELKSKKSLREQYADRMTFLANQKQKVEKLLAAA